MRVLFLTDNFPPETNAPAVRTFEHARAWVELGHDVTVITGAPNFPTGRIHAGYANRPRKVESMAGIRVVRVWTYVRPNEGTVRRSLDYLSYMLSAIPAGLIERRPDVVVGTSPQLLTVLAAWVVSRLKRAPCVFELRDLWPESMVAVGIAREGAATRAVGRVADFLYRRVDRIVAVTESFAEFLFDRGVPPGKVAVVKNGVDINAFCPEARDERLRGGLGVAPSEFLVTYVGTVGMAHGLEIVLDAAEASRDEAVTFLIVGDGARRSALEEVARRKRLENVRFLSAQPRSRVPGILGASDAVLVHLTPDPLFASVIPSKLFEGMAMARPIVLGVAGESAELVRDAGCGIAFTPGDPAALLDAVRRLARDPDGARRLGQNGRRAAEERYSRRAAAVRMLGVLEGVAGS